MSTLADRLKTALARTGRTQSELSKGTGISHASVSFWVSGRTKTLSAKNATAVASFLGVNVKWLVEGVGPMLADGTPSSFDADLVAVPFFRIRFAAGDSTGEPTYEEVHDQEAAYYPRSTLIKHHLTEATCKSFIVRGISMEPSLCDGDVILVDCSYQPRILDGRVYAFCYQGELRVKRLYKRITGEILIRSDNQDRSAYPDEILTAADLDRFKLIGRVVERSGPGNL